ncbi:MAG: hypothetical protein Q9220_000245 [cf. Caloplaca sp. 1 TL-2023]
MLLAPDKDQTVFIRTESLELCANRNANALRRRSHFRVITDRVRTGSAMTSYSAHITSNIDTAILGLCRQIHNEAAHVLYSGYTFDFDLDIESIVPFFQDLTPAARASVQSIQFAKRALPYSKEFDRCEWQNTCAFLASQMTLRQVSLRIAGGNPGFGLWMPEHPSRLLRLWSAEQFEAVMQREEMEWARQLVAINGLRNLEVIAALEHCPAPVSEEMAFFVQFSANIQPGFATFLRRTMLLES